MATDNGFAKKSPMDTITCSNCGSTLFEFQVLEKGFSYRAPTWGVCAFVRKSAAPEYEIFCPSCKHVELFTPEKPLWALNGAPYVVWHVSHGNDKAGFNSLFPMPVGFRFKSAHDVTPLIKCISAFGANIERVAAIGRFSIRIAGLNRARSRNDAHMEQYVAAANRKADEFNWESHHGRCLQAGARYRWGLYQHPIDRTQSAIHDNYGLTT